MPAYQSAIVTLSFHRRNLRARVCLRVSVSEADLTLPDAITITVPVQFNRL
jgi:hypothetical protein